MTLEESNLFHHLPAPELAGLRGLASEISFQPGDCIFSEGDPGDALYVVKTGTVQISAMSESDQNLQLATVLPGEIFGEMAVLDDRPRSATASADGLTVVYRIPRQKLLALLERSPPLTLAVMRAISLRMRDFNQRYTRTVLTTERMALIGRFARSIVHDLKSPLGTILMAIDLGCREDRSNPENRQICHELVVKQVERVENLVNEILEFTHGTPGETPLTDTDYVAFVRSLVAELEPEAKLSSVRLAFEAPSDPVVVPLHEHRLSRVFHNLVHNATEAMHRGGQIDIRIRPEEKRVLTEIADTGPGLPVELMEQLFEPFATFGKSTGTGLGLSICRKIIEEHGGEIAARNRPEGGALFSFSLKRTS